MYVCVCVFVDKSNPNKCMLCKAVSSLLLKGFIRAYASWVRVVILNARFGISFVPGDREHEGLCQY